MQYNDTYTETHCGMYNPAELRFKLVYKPFDVAAAGHIAADYTHRSTSGLQFLDHRSRCRLIRS